MAFAGVSHVSITVSDLDASRSWYGQILGWNQVLESRTDSTTYAIGLLGDGTALVLRAHDAPLTGAFDERRPGLDHLSLAVTSEDDLSDLEAKLATAKATSHRRRTTSRPRCSASETPTTWRSRPTSRSSHRAWAPEPAERGGVSAPVTAVPGKISEF